MTLLPFDPNQVYYLWFLKWREHVRAAKQTQDNQGFCYAACLAQAEYIIHYALEVGRMRKAGLL